MRKKFGRKLLLLRKARGLSQDELCANIEDRITKAAYGKIERGISLPKIDTLDLITDALNLEYTYFYNDYLQLVNDKKTLNDFAWRCARMNHYTFARKITSKRIRLAKRQRNRSDIVLCVCDLMHWNHREGKGAHPRALLYLVDNFHILNKDQMYQVFKNIFVN